MPQHSHLAEAPSNTSYGQVIEYIAGEPPQPRNYCSTPGQVPTGYAPLQGSAIDVSGQYSDMTILHVKDRLYLASYTHQPDENTPFPYPAAKQSRSPSKRSARAQQGPQAASQEKSPPIYFTIDNSLLYAFSSYAASWPVPQIYNLRAGTVVDVSREPGFAS
ncbi:MAG: hypothetical protein EOO77_33715, partial [Oxalobacteraceae bacterium]